MHRRHIVAGLFDLIVQIAVLTAVRSFLFDEGVDLRLLLLGDFVAKVPDALDEEGFPLREGEREAVVEGGSDGIAADHNRFRVLVTVRLAQG